MMQTVLETLRDIIGVPDFYVRLENQQNYSWDYGAMIEYIIAGTLILIVVSSVFKILKGWLCR